MRQKRVNAGQKISGNLSAAAINALPRLIENDQMRELDKPSGPISTADAPGHFVFGTYSGGLAVGEWGYLNRALFPAIGAIIPVDEATWFFQNELANAPTPEALGVSGPTQYVKNMVPAMHVGQGKFQISGLARTRIQFPAGSDPTSNIYRTALFSGPDKMPTATASDNGVMDIIWHKEIDSENRIHAAIVRFPSAPRPPRTAQFNLRCNGLVHSSGGLVEANGSDGQILSGANTYLGMQKVSPQDIEFLRSGDFLISLSVYLESYTWTSRPSRTGKIIVELFKRAGVLAAGKNSVWGNIKTAEENGQPFNQEIIASSMHLVQIQAGDKFSVKASADIGTANVGVQMTISGPYSNHFPEASAYY